jgi:hypothetical protein
VAQLVDLIMPAVMEMWETEDDQYVLFSLSRFARRLSPHFTITVDWTNDDNITQLTSMLHAHEMKLLTQRNMFSDLRSPQSPLLPRRFIYFNGSEG